MKKLISWFLSSTNYSTPANWGILVLRLGFGLTLMLNHGMGKLANYPTMSEKFADPLGVGSAVSLGLAVFAEFFCSLALALGLFTRLTLVPLVINMSVAFLVIHSSDPFSKKELALLYDVVFVALLLVGGGKYSIDNFIFGKSKNLS